MSQDSKRPQDSLRILRVILRESRVSVKDDTDLPAFDRSETLSQSYRAVSNIRETILTGNDDQKHWVYSFFYTAGIRLIFSDEEEESKKDDYEPIVEIVGVFEAKYISEKKLSEDELSDFSVDNVGYHVWPYWREYVQSTSARIGFSPIFEVPIYIVKPKVEKAK